MSADLVLQFQPDQEFGGASGRACSAEPSSSAAPARRSSESAVPAPDIGAAHVHLDIPQSQMSLGQSHAQTRVRAGIGREPFQKSDGSAHQFAARRHAAREPLHQAIYLRQGTVGEIHHLSHAVVEPPVRDLPRARSALLFRAVMLRFGHCSGALRLLLAGESQTAGKLRGMRLAQSHGHASCQAGQAIRN